VAAGDDTPTKPRAPRSRAGDPVVMDRAEETLDIQRLVHDPDIGPMPPGVVLDELQRGEAPPSSPIAPGNAAPPPLRLRTTLLFHAALLALGSVTVVALLVFFWTAFRDALGLGTPAAASGSSSGSPLPPLEEASSATSGMPLVIDSSPSRAEVLVDGVPRGRTPLLSNILCEPGRSVRVEVRSPGRPSWTWSGLCTGSGVKLRAVFRSR
jgi:hypothetical protein